MTTAKKKKELPSEVVLNIKWHQVPINSDMTEDQINYSIWFALQCHDFLEQNTIEFETSNVQLNAENDWYAEINNKLNFNIEIQVMMLNLIKKEIGDEKYKAIRNKVTTCPEYLKLKSRAGL